MVLGERKLTMMESPTSLVAFSSMFPSEKECADYLFQVRWPKGFACPRCENLGGYPVLARKIVECSNPACRYQASLTAGTVLHRTKQSLYSWFWAAYLLTNLTPSISAKQFQEQLGISSYETAFCMLHKLRSALVAPGRDRLRGEVEIDEGYVGGKEEGNIGRGAVSKQIVVGAVERIRWIDPKSGKRRVRCGRIRLEAIPDVAGATLRKFVVGNVAKGTKVLTDGWTGYSFVKKAGFKHSVQVRVDEKESMPHFHRVISNLKTWIKGTYHGAVQPKHLQSYLNEYTFRFNRRFLKGKGFNRALGLSTELSGPTYDDLYADHSEMALT